jgi:HEAT repeat protein
VPVSTVETTPESIPVPSPQSPPISTQDPPPDVNTLAAKFRSEQDAGVRAEIVADLWEINTRESVEALRLLFHGERDPDVKADFLAGVADASEKAIHESCYGLLLSAIAPGQPSDIRLLAAQLFTDFEDARVPGLLQQFSQDPDPEVREAVKDAIESLREKQDR